MQVCTDTSSTFNVACEIVFHYADATTSRADYSSCGCTSSYFIPASGSLQGRFLGFSYVKVISYSSPRIDSDQFTVWVDSDPCSLTKISCAAISNMTLQVMGAAASQALTVTNSIAVAQSDASYCGAYSYTLTPSLTFFSAANEALSG